MSSTPSVVYEFRGFSFTIEGTEGDYVFKLYVGDVGGSPFVSQSYAKVSEALAAALRWQMDRVAFLQGDIERVQQEQAEAQNLPLETPPGPSPSWARLHYINDYVLENHSWGEDSRKLQDEFDSLVGEFNGDLPLLGLRVAEDWEDRSNTLPKGICEDLLGATIIHHIYHHDSYEGEAFTLYSKNGKLFECHGSHCSCYGLEGQWDPEETTIAALRARIADLCIPGEYSRGISPTKQAILGALDKLENPFGRKIEAGLEKLEETSGLPSLRRSKKK